MVNKDGKIVLDSSCPGAKNISMGEKNQLIKKAKELQEVLDEKKREAYWQKMEKHW